MTTKNIQDVVAEKIEMIVDLCIDQLLGGYDVRVEDPHRLQLFKDQLELKLTTTLTQLVKEAEAGEREKFVTVLNDLMSEPAYSVGRKLAEYRDNLTPTTIDVTENQPMKTKNTQDERRAELTPEEKLHRKGKCQNCIGSNKPVKIDNLRSNPELTKLVHGVIIGIV